MRKSETVVKIDLAENWEKAQRYIPAEGTIIIYEYSDTKRRIKIGDGITLVNDLPFLGNPPLLVDNDVLQF